MKKKIMGVIVIITLSMVTLIGCGKKVESGTSDRLKKKAADVIELINEDNYKEIIAQSTTKMQEGLTADVTKEVAKMIKESGAFQKIEKSSVEEKGGNYTTVTIANYDNGKRVFTISFNQDDEISGLYIK